MPNSFDCDSRAGPAARMPGLRIVLPLLEPCCLLLQVSPLAGILGHLWLLLVLGTPKMGFGGSVGVPLQPEKRRSVLEIESADYREPKPTELASPCFAWFTHVSESHQNLVFNDGTYLSWCSDFLFRDSPKPLHCPGSFRPKPSQVAPPEGPSRASWPPIAASAPCLPRPAPALPRGPQSSARGLEPGSRTEFGGCSVPILKAPNWVIRCRVPRQNHPPKFRCGGDKLLE